MYFLLPFSVLGHMQADPSSLIEHQSVLPQTGHGLFDELVLVADDEGEVEGALTVGSGLRLHLYRERHLVGALLPGDRGDDTLGELGVVSELPNVEGVAFLDGQFARVALGPGGASGFS